MSTIHLNIDLHKTDSAYVSIITTRLWSYIPPSINWLIRTPTPAMASIQGGLSIIIINSLAILVEGFITDILASRLEDSALKNSEVIDFDIATWHPKKKFFKKLFEKDLSTYSKYKSIEALFNLRNNLSHGKSHVEQNSKDTASGGISSVKSLHKNYQSARQYLVEKKLLNDTSDISNVEVLWKFNIALFFFFEVKAFLFDVINSIEFDRKSGIFNELQTAYYGTP